jgi:hypothetical protein
MPGRRGLQLSNVLGQASPPRASVGMMAGWASAGENWHRFCERHSLDSSARPLQAAAQQPALRVASVCDRPVARLGSDRCIGDRPTDDRCRPSGTAREASASATRKVTPSFSRR